jgi:hypothetical protein
MSELRPAPVDRMGVPLPIIPSEDLSKIDRQSVDFTGHHEFFLPGTAIFQELGAKACRSARVLGAERVLHNKGPNRFHRFYDISDVPADEQAQANILMLSLAGYLPGEGVELWSGEPVIRELNEEERARLCEVDPESSLTLRNLRTDRAEAARFLKKFVLKQSPINVSPSVLNEFTSTTKIRLTRAAGHEVLESAVQTAVEPVSDYYKEAWREGLLHPAAPISPEDLVLSALGNFVRRDQLLHPLRESLMVKAAAA